MGVKRHVAVAITGTLLLVTGVIAGMLWILAENRQVVSDPLEVILVSPFWRGAGGWLSLLLALAGLVTATLAIGRLNRSLLSNWLPAPHLAAEVLHLRVQLSRGPSVIAFGGGTGLSNLLRGLREHTSNVTAVVSVSDDGGSSGRLRAAFDMPAPGDLADCLAALSDNELEVSRLLDYRFSRGAELEGHTFGNLLITTLTEVEGDFGRAARVLNRLLNLVGSVYPATSQPTSLLMTKASGEQVEGESRARHEPGPIQDVALVPAAPRPLPEVIEAVGSADVVVLGPGSLFTSTLPPILVPDIATAIREVSAPLVYVCNIMTEAGETDGFDALDHVTTLARHLGRNPDVVVVNGTRIDDARLAAYREEGADVVAVSVEALRKRGIAVAQLPLLGPGPHAQHDSARLARWLTTFARRTQPLSLELPA
jgi:uncharacterized cofD-like protein